MTDSVNWQLSSKAFFDQRASQVSGNELSDLCFVSGRDPRLWSDQDVYDDLISSILAQTSSDDKVSLLEVGCASGFLAWGLAKKVNHYVGVDVAARALKAAAKLKLHNASFRSTDGKVLPFEEASFDAAVCYDVFTNFPDISVGKQIIQEMLRVVRPGKRVLIGSVPDAETYDGYVEKVKSVSEDLDKKYGPLSQSQSKIKRSLFERVRSWWRPAHPEIICYYFQKRDFIEFGAQLGVKVDIVDMHPLNPYADYRFNVVYTKNS